MNPRKKSNVLLWVGAAAAAGGVVALVAITKWKERKLQSEGIKTHLRDVQSVLTDCYQKIREIEKHIPTATNLTSPSIS